MESLFVSIIGLGEGWHNYHHAFPWDYKASEFGMHFNGTTRIIEWFAKIGWAYDLREVSHRVMESRILKTGDGSHPLYGSNKNSEINDLTFVQEYNAKHLGKEFDAEEDALKES